MVSVSPRMVAARTAAAGGAESTRSSGSPYTSTAFAPDPLPPDCADCAPHAVSAPEGYLASLFLLLDDCAPIVKKRGEGRGEEEERESERVSCSRSPPNEMLCFVVGDAVF